MSELAQNRKNFDVWFATILESLMMDPNSGFILAMISFPLLERYLKRKTGAEPAQLAFRQGLLKVIPELKTKENAEQFWNSYRHGLLHNVMLNRDKDWLSADMDIIRVDAERLWMNPALFAARVVEIIQQDFEIFAQGELPQVQAVHVAPTPGSPGPHQIVLGTGSRK